jgi:hypothetical protein
MDGTAKPHAQVRASANWAPERIASERAAASLRTQRRDEQERVERLATRVSALLSSPPLAVSRRSPRPRVTVRSRLPR